MTDFIGRLIDSVQPGLVVFTGDQVEDTEIEHTAEEVKFAIDSYAHQAISRQTPWAMVFGNHDEGKSYSRQQMLSYITSLPYAYSQSGPLNIGGTGNYELNVTSAGGKSAFRMYFLDTGVKGAISNRQNVYLRQRADANKPEKLAAILFYHSPIPEYVLGKEDKVLCGHQGEKVSYGPQSGLMDTIVAMGDVKATFVGHDHYNDYCVLRRGIQLCYGGGVGYGAAYGDPKLPRSARVIQWKRNSTAEVITTWKQADGDFAKYEFTLYSRSL
ncbi:calcineurin-like phosphoesterase [Achlya hypogyna]|uniref:Calcineurin-like phosphoesterase n=1 Tax=Achlya hypogyna TaxID=1202772 RepID=A0A1V9Z7X3_ACHHY|nr:calcineurin-like phosphoesterase [Achlya hypogyna]